MKGGPGWRDCEKSPRAHGGAEFEVFEDNEVGGGETAVGLVLQGGKMGRFKLEVSAELEPLHGDDVGRFALNVSQKTRNPKIPNRCQRSHAHLSHVSSSWHQWVSRAY